MPSRIKEEFGPSVHRRAKEANRGILALKWMAHQRWPKPMKRNERPWKKTWYEPFDDIDKVSLGLRFTSNLPAHAMIRPAKKPHVTSQRVSIGCGVCDRRLCSLT